MTEPIAVPEKLSDLIRMAIADGRKLHQERPHDHYPNYGRYHGYRIRNHDESDEEGPFDACHICLAGAVMAGTLQVPLESVSIQRIRPPWHSALLALDNVRDGMYREAINTFYNVDRQYELTPWTKAEPVNPMFQGWDEFLEHLDSLESVAGFFEFNGF